MPKLSPFRLSFDGPLGSRERTRARVTAALISAAALVLGTAGFFALLNASSQTMNTWSNSRPEQDVRMLSSGGESPSGKPTPKQGVGTQQVAPPPASRPAAQTETKAGPETTGSTGAAETSQAAVSPSPMAAPKVTVQSGAKPRQDSAARALTRDPRRTESNRTRAQREEARRLRAERDARRDARRAYAEDRMFRGWGEHTRRGPVDDDFFRFMR